MRLLFSATNSVISNYVCWHTESNYSHVDIVLDDDCVFACLPKDGVHVVDLRTARSDTIRMLEIEIELDDDQRLLIRDLLWAQIDKPYDWGGAVGVGLRRNWQSDSKWFCSELAAWVLTQVGVMRKLPTRGVSPTALLDHVLQLPSHTVLRSTLGRA